MCYEPKKWHKSRCELTPNFMLLCAPSYDNSCLIFCNSNPAWLLWHCGAGWVKIKISFGLTMLFNAVTWFTLEQSIDCCWVRAINPSLTNRAVSSVRSWSPPAGIFWSQIFWFRIKYKVKNHFKLFKVKSSTVVRVLLQHILHQLLLLKLSNLNGGNKIRLRQ